MTDHSEQTFIFKISDLERRDLIAALEIANDLAYDSDRSELRERLTTLRDLRDRPLEIHIVDGLLTIAIGTGTLTGAIRVGPTFDQAEILDSERFAQDILLELCREEEDGTTPIHRLFDDAACAAAENGSEWIRIADDERSE